MADNLVMFREDTEFLAVVAFFLKEFELIFYFIIWVNEASRDSLNNRS